MSTPKSSPLSPTLALVLISAASLFLEIALIRWLSSEVRVFAHIRNVALIGCFVGLALGYPLTRLRLPLWVSPLCALGLMLASLPPLLAGDYTLKLLSTRLFNSDVFSQVSLEVLKLWLPGMIQFLLAFVVLIFVFFPMGQRIGELFRQLQASPLRAYSFNVLASLVGVLLFNAVSFASIPPQYWMLSGSLVLALAASNLREMFTCFCISLVLFAASFFQQLPHPAIVEQVWSPYQKVEVWKTFATPGRPWKLSYGQGAPSSDSVAFYMLCSNDTPMMWMLDMSNKTRAANPWLSRPGKIEWYDMPYRFYPAPQRVLVIGAGGGNDVAAALRGGAQRVDAVEIDPVIQRMGRKYHPEQPYSDPRVHVHINDARAYLSQTSDKFDLIVFGQLDNTDWNLMSNLSNIRMDSYIYTLESLKQSYSLLKPGGIMVLNFGANDFWGQRVTRLLVAATGSQPLSFRNELQYHFDGQENTYIVGDLQRCRRALESDPELAAWHRAKGVEWDGNKEKCLVTDDWPYWYLAAPTIPPLHLALSLLFLGVIVAIAVAVLPSGFALDGHFWALGAAFTLLETHLISKLALLFGSTWQVNGIVISAVLLMILAANIWVEKLGPPAHQKVYPALLLACFLQYCLPPEKFLMLGASGTVLSLALYALPVFFAGLIFARSFSRAARPDQALTANLLGAATGGFLEAISYVTGLNFLTLLVLALYATSWFFVHRSR